MRYLKGPKDKGQIWIDMKEDVINPAGSEQYIHEAEPRQ